MTDETQEELSYPAGVGFEVNCPGCGETLWVFVPKDGNPTVTRMRDIPDESEDD